jgi:CubicO group peptidase (beta-lactamase class C family)
MRYAYAMRRYTAKFTLLILAVLALALAGCSALRVTGAADASAAPPPAPAFSATLPPPAALPKSASAVGMQRVRTGAEYEASYPNHMVSPAGDRAIFSPWWDPHLDPPATDLAYAIYSFSLRPEDPADVVELSWQPGPGADICWVGVSNWTRGTWSWVQCTGRQFPLPPRADSVSPEGRVLVAVVLTGAINYFIPLKLCWVRLGAATPDYDFSAIDTVMNTASSDLDGTTLLIMQDGELLYWKSFAGFDLNQRVAIASASKWLTAGLLLRVIDAAGGNLALDDTTNEWLNWGAGDPRRGTITMRQLYAHVSGLQGNSVFVGNDSYTWEEMANHVRLDPLLFDPGTNFHYGEVSMQIASYICMLAANESDYNALLADELTTPLGMAQTSFTENDGTTHAQPLASAGLFSTARDYALYLQLLLDGGVHDGAQFISPALMTELFTDQIPPSVQPPFDYTPAQEDTRYNLGNWREVVNPADAAELWAASSQGAFGFSPWIDFRRHLVGVLCVKKTLDDVAPLYTDMRTALAGVIPE